MNAALTGPLCDYEGRIISLLGRVDASAINLVVDQLLRLDADSDKPITVYISSQGGNIIEGLKLLDTVGLLRSPLTTAALGLVEGAGLILLAIGHQRILYPSAVLSTGGLWDLPDLHESTKRVGLHQDAHTSDQLRAQICDRLAQLVDAAGSRLPSMFAEASSLPQIFDAADAVRLGIADTIIEGPHRHLTKPITKLNKYAKSGSSPTL